MYTCYKKNTVQATISWVGTIGIWSNGEKIGEGQGFFISSSTSKHVGVIPNYLNQNLNIGQYYTLSNYTGNQMMDNIWEANLPLIHISEEGRYIFKETYGATNTPWELFG